MTLQREWTRLRAAMSPPPNLLALAGLGLLLGFRHAFEPDHLAAVSTLATRQGRLLDACRLGLAWALGHTASVGVVVGAIVLFGLRLPDRLWPAADILVALLLIGLGGTVASAHARACRRPAPSSPQPRPRDGARARAPAGRCAPLARVRPAAWTRGERRDPGAARCRGTDARHPAGLLCVVRGGNDDRDAHSVGLARGRGAARLDAGCAVGDTAPRGQRGGERRGRSGAGRASGLAVRTRRTGGLKRGVTGRASRASASSVREPPVSGHACSNGWTAGAY